VIFSSVYGNNYNCIARLSSNGNLDNTFSIGNGFNSVVYSIDLQTDGKIIAGGSFSTYNGNNSKGIVRILNNGALDLSFNSGNGISNDTAILFLKTLPNNKIVITGTFLSYNNILRNQIARLHLTCNLSPTLDLIIKDGSDDTGIQPNTVTPYMWTSDNIWVRNNNDNGLVHENPDYSDNGNPNFVKVKVINNSCVTSSGSTQLKLYWAKASTALSYPNPWMGGITHPISLASMGSPIGTLSIPTLQAGQEIILTFPWIVPNPADYGNDGDQWHFCLLARIEAVNDPMSSPETWDLNANVRNNNNIAWKNVSVVDIIPNNIVNPGGVIAVGNPFDHPKTFFLEMEIADLETGKPIYEEAEIGIKMDEILYNAWIRGGGKAQELEPTHDETRKIVRGNNVILDNLSFDANEIGTLRLDFNFLTRELTNKTNYAYHVIQKDSENGEIIGGETFIINKNQRELFEANAGNSLEVDLNQSITISAEDINEPALYNWYDSEGNLIYEGKDLQISNAISEKYKLEVISTVDGFKDYTEIVVKLKPSSLENINPNPAQNNVKIGYKLNSVNSAYLMILGYYVSNGTSNNYILDVNSNEIDINISNYPSGFYTVALVIDGNIIDAKILIKQ
jgi:serine protease